MTDSDKTPAMAAWNETPPATDDDDDDDDRLTLWARHCLSRFHRQMEYKRLNRQIETFADAHEYFLDRAELSVDAARTVLAALLPVLAKGTDVQGDLLKLQTCLTDAHEHLFKARCRGGWRLPDGELRP